MSPEPFTMSDTREEGFSSSLKVGHLIENFLPINETYVYDVITYLDIHKKLEQYVFTFKRTNSEIFPYPRVFAFHSLPFLIKNLYRAKAVMNRVQYGVPYWSPIIKRNKVSLIHSHFVWTGLSAIHLKYAARVPFLVTLYGEDEIKQTVLPLPKLEEYRQVFNEAELVLSVSGFMADRALSIGADKRKLRIWHPGIRLPERTKATSHKTTKEQYRILTVARLVSVKGLKYLISALPEIRREFKHTELFLVGAGPEEQVLRELCRELQVDGAVHFLGALPHAEVLPLYATADVFVLPSIIEDSGNVENLPTVLLEAQAYGIPVVSTSVGGIPETMVDSVTGKLVGPRNPEQLAKAIMEILGTADLRQRMAVAGRTFVEENFNIVKQSELLATIYSEILTA